MESIQSFLDYLELEKNYSSHTVTAYRNDLKSFLNFVVKEFAEDTIEQIEYPFIRNWIVHLVSSKVSNRTINRKISSLRSYYKFLQKIGLREATPLSKHKALKTDKKIQVSFSTTEIKSVLEGIIPETFEDYRDRAIIELFYSTGMRRSELINLKQSDINFSQQQVKVIGKRNKERILPLINSTMTALEDYIDESKKEFDNIEGFLFLTSKGDKIYETLAYRIIKGYFAKVSTKLKKSPHILRHSFATHILNEGANLNAVKDLLGHSSLATTQIYTHNDVEKLKRAYESAHPRNSK